MTSFDRAESITRHACRHAAWLVAAVAALWAFGASAAPGTVQAAQQTYTASVSVDRSQRDFVFPREAVATQATVPERKKPLAAKASSLDNSAVTFIAAGSERLPLPHATANPRHPNPLPPAAPSSTTHPRAPPSAH